MSGAAGGSGGASFSVMVASADSNSERAGGAGGGIGAEATGGAAGGSTPGSWAPFPVGGADCLRSLQQRVRVRACGPEDRGGLVAGRGDDRLRLAVDLDAAGRQFPLDLEQRGVDDVRRVDRARECRLCATLPLPGCHDRRLEPAAFRGGVREVLVDISARVALDGTARLLRWGRLHLAGL